MPAFLSLRLAGAALAVCSAWGSHFGGFSGAAGLSGAQASVVAAPGL